MKCNNCGKEVPYGSSCKCRNQYAHEKNDKKQDVSIKVDDSDTCCYCHGALRCTLYPTIQICGKWMCSTHYKFDRKGDSKSAIEFLNLVNANKREVERSLSCKHWSDEMLDNWMKGIKPDNWTGDKIPKYSDINPPRKRTEEDENRVSRVMMEFDSKNYEIDKDLSW